MKNEKENEDLFNLSSPLGNYVNINIDIQSLGVLENKTQTRSGLTDSQFLLRERCIAESRMIKSKIIYKMDNELDLTNSEKKYMKAWKKAMKTNMTLIEDCLVPATPSAL